jgi:hypothetical protein
MSIKTDDRNRAILIIPVPQPHDDDRSWLRTMAKNEFSPVFPLGSRRILPKLWPVSTN